MLSANIPNLELGGIIKIQFKAFVGWLLEFGKFN